MSGREPGSFFAADFSGFDRLEKKVFNAYRKRAQNAINRTLTGFRKDVTERIIARTGLKRKEVNDRQLIRRASPQSLEGSVFIYYGTRLFMKDYPTSIFRNRQGQTVIRLDAQIYRKQARTAFRSRDGKNILIKLGEGKRSRFVKMFGRAIPRLFREVDDQFHLQSRLDQRFADEWESETINVTI